MESTLLTPRLKLTPITRAERGSKELTWLHALRSDKQATAWSIHPPSQTLADTEKIVQTYLPDRAAQAHRLVYAVHETASEAGGCERGPAFVGTLSLISLSSGALQLPAHLVAPSEPASLVVELAYAFLPGAWGRGYATEALRVVLDACRSPPCAPVDDFWTPWRRVWVRVIVNGRNPASLRVMRKMSEKGVREMGVYKWEGEKIFIGGEWRTEDDLYIFGGWLKGGV